ncbi:hypothetical protein FB567DRAFT_485510 [Paraphoma chrysanthemicola]|uniref:Enoyl reductase (ER) domain-containing protein n=1 Tax=Paraphoma chrysanthemicola TaxID=798071 RepID=A0A8K0RHJ3_9PLEO|nr:hypothetical protein FB567DRAFT_485510 [Paraphoma chrysanthemicola]
MAIQRGVIIDGPGVAKVVSDRDIAPLRDDYVLVKVKAVALNPTDWKARDTEANTKGAGLGVDYAGVVEKVADGDVNKKWKKGDRIAGSVHGAFTGNSRFHADGTFAEWTVGRTGIALRLPNSMSFEEGATLGAGVISCGQALYQQLGLPPPNNPTSSPSSVLIYGASTATGTLAVQLAKLSGLRVLATCSPRNFELVKSRGADMVFDYNSPSAVQDIKTATDNQLGLIFDCVGENNSPSFCYEAMGKDGGKLSSLLPPAGECPRKDIVLSMVFAYTAYGEAFTKFGHDVAVKWEDYLFASNFFAICEELLAAGKLKPHPIAHRPNGLDGILDGLDELREGRVRGEKLVYSV